jgi:hypothetical protein
MKINETKAFGLHRFLTPQMTIQYIQDLDYMADVLMGFHQSTFSKLNTEFNSDPAPCNFWAFPTMKREFQGTKF